MLKNGSRRLLHGPATRKSTSQSQIAAILPSFLVPAWAPLATVTVRNVPKASLARAASYGYLQARCQSTSGPEAEASTSNSAYLQPGGYAQAVRPMPLLFGENMSASGDAKSHVKHPSSKPVKSLRDLRETRKEAIFDLQAIPPQAAATEKHRQVASILAGWLSCQSPRHRLAASDVDPLRNVVAEVLAIPEDRAGLLLGSLRRLPGEDASDLFETAFLAVQATHWQHRLTSALDGQKVSRARSAEPSDTSQDEDRTAQARNLSDFAEMVANHCTICLDAAPLHSAALLRPAIDFFVAVAKQYGTRSIRQLKFDLVDIAARVLRPEESKHLRPFILYSLVTPAACLVGGRDYDRRLSRWIQEEFFADNLPVSIVASLVQEATKAGLPKSAHSLFICNRIQTSRGSPNVPGLSSLDPTTSRATSEDLDSSILTKTASLLVRNAIRRSEIREAAATLSTLDNIDKPAANTPEIWQRKLEVWFLQSPNFADRGLSFRDQLVGFLQNMDAAQVPADAYFCCALLRGIATSNQAFGEKSRIFREVYCALPADMGRPHWLTMELAGIQSDLALFEQAQRNGTQLPWLPAIEQSGLSSMPLVFSHEDQTIYDRFTVLCTMLRHQIYRKHWQAAVRTYKGLLEITKAETLKKDILQLTLHGCFVRLVSSLLAEGALHRVLDVCSITLADASAPWITSRLLTRALLASSAPDAGPDKGEQASKLFVPFLRLIRQWAVAKLGDATADTPLVDLEEGRYLLRSLRAVVPDNSNLDRLAEAALRKLFRLERKAIPVEERLSPVRELLDTLVTLHADVSYRRWWDRLARYMDKAELDPVSRRRWTEALPLLEDMFADAEAEKIQRREDLRKLGLNSQVWTGTMEGKLPRAYE